MNASPEEGRLPTMLARVRREGLWVLAGLAPLASALSIPLGGARVALADVVLAVLAAAALVEIVRYRAPWREAVAPAAAWALVMVAIISTGSMIVLNWRDLRAGDVVPSAVEIVQLVEVFIVGYGWTLWAVRDRRAIERSLLAIAAAVTLNVLFALGQLASGAHVFHVRGLFANRNTLGVFLAVTLPVLVAAGSAERYRAPVRIWLLLVSALGLALMTSGGLFAAASIGVLVAAFRVSRRAGLAALAAVAVIALLIQPLALPKVREAQYRSVDLFPADKRGSRSPSARARRWAAVLECLRENPTFGVGPGQFQRRIEGYYLRGWGKGGGRSDDPDAFDVTFDEPGSQCLWEVAACETGLVGLLALAWFLAAALCYKRPNGTARSTDFENGLSKSAERPRAEPLVAAEHAENAEKGGPLKPSAVSARSAVNAVPSVFRAGAFGAVTAVVVAGLFASVMVQGVALPFVMVLALAARRARAA